MAQHQNDADREIPDSLNRREKQTSELSNRSGVRLQLVIERAKTYEQLNCPELAVADAFVAYLLSSKEYYRLKRAERRDVDKASDSSTSENSEENEVIEVNDSDTDEDEEEDDEPTTLDAQWEADTTTPTATRALELKLDALKILHRCAVALGCGGDVRRWKTEMTAVMSSVKAEVGDESEPEGEKSTKYGFSHRLIYPWNTHEPDRTSSTTLEEINALLTQAAPDLEAKECKLPVLSHNSGGEASDLIATNEAAMSTQLGLVARRDLLPGSTLLREKSVLTAIRPRDGALCDTCAQDLESIPFDKRRECDGDECDIVYCSEECKHLAMSKYHRPRKEGEEEILDDDSQMGGKGKDEIDGGVECDEHESINVDASSTAPFCGDMYIHSIGRVEDTTSPEWDLYFLLLTRTFQLAETQNVHPLDLSEIKYLWGDFSPASDENTNLPPNLPKTLPFSLRHHVELPLQWFEELMLSRPASATPYSAEWLQMYDWWIIQTLYAKFRGVANAQQSTWTGKPEIAAVHPLWCLANHSCNPNVEWSPSGVRSFTVRKERVWTTSDSDPREWGGIKKGEQVWSHYTDVSEKDQAKRRERLQEVLGGDCMCERCIEGDQT